MKTITVIVILFLFMLAIGSEIRKVNEEDFMFEKTSTEESMEDDSPKEWVTEEFLKDEVVTQDELETEEPTTEQQMTEDPNDLIECVCRNKSKLIMEKNNEKIEYKKWIYALLIFIIIFLMIICSG